MKETKFICSCGCGKTDVSSEEAPEGWFVLENPVHAKGDRPKLLEPPHFASINCLHRWSTKAVKELPGLIKMAESLRPHGTLQSRGLAELYI